MRASLHFSKQALFRPLVRLLAISSAIMSLALGLTGCGKPPVTVSKHMLEYPSPETRRSPQVPETLKVNLFSVAQAFNSDAMVYRPTSYQSETYSYHRWRVNPGQMVTDFLLRDLRHSGRFKAVFGEDSNVKTRFLLEGSVAEFQEVDAGEDWSGVLALNVTLIDTSREEIPQRILFQKNYRVAEPFVDKTPQGLAAALSRAMEKLSAAIISDVQQAAWKRSLTKEKITR